MTFKLRLAQTASEVEHRLVEILASDSASTPERLAAAMRHGVLGGGKRFRPFLLVESASLFGVDRQHAIEAACALELIHCYSLVHDDLPAMDNDLTRRGQPSVWAAYDEWTAILAGDGLLTLAFELASHPRCHPDAAVRTDLVTVLARAAGRSGMVGGQVIDLEADKLGQPASPTLDHIRRLQAMKTGALIRVAVEAGAVMGCASPVERAQLARFGEHLGFAFQISDDLLDAEGDAATVGKATGKDAAANKATLVSLLGIPAARTRLAEVEAAALAEIARFGPASATMAEAVRFMSQRES